MNSRRTASCLSREEFIRTPEGERFHIFDALALVNVLLCSAGPEGRSVGRSTNVMRSNCLRHFAATMAILEPTLVVHQGHGVQRWVGAAFGPMETRTPYLSEARHAGNRTLACRFSHPTAHQPLRWGDRRDAPTFARSWSRRFDSQRRCCSGPV